VAYPRFLLKWMTNYARGRSRGTASVFHEENRDALKPDEAWRSNQIAHAFCGLTLVGEIPADWCKKWSSLHI
jgi:hypothetical protein